MEKFAVFFVIALMLTGLIRLLLAPMRLIWKLVTNGICGFVCLWLLSLSAGLTGICLPINPVTCLVSGTLGLPGLALLLILQFLL